MLDYPFTPPTAVDPPDEWRELRATCPVAPVRTPAGIEALLLTRYDDVRTTITDRRFVRNTPAGSNAVGTQAAFMADEAQHMRWRRLLSRSFTAKRMTALEPGIARITHDLIDEMTKQGPPADLRTALGFPLPVYVICDLLGVPAADRERFARWSDHFLNLTRYTAEEARQSGLEMWQYMLAHVEAKRSAPGDDLLSELVTVVDSEDGRLTEQECVFTGQALLVAGHETTANMIGKMVAMLLAERGRWELLLAEPGLVPSAVEEVLRFDANLGFGMHRLVTERTEIAGTVVEAGTTVLSSTPSANRDERVFDHPDEMDLARSPNPHLTFGAGPHSCLGQSLARVELRTVLAVLLERLPGLELAVPVEELRRRQGLLVGGLEEVPVRW
ncbi:cytochrome P450 [Actinoplanes campanulatus]|uniref:Cytochrome P450 n=1 Tax=Actinoplanes campanulatus TaxID=113559 RepID=A0A7W5AH26_9ACTN|nr:cytochrome P450 [Actinoplanes campanulatus]MBB3096197.1 cytochrome P450 [Actinoplanes campanulatus]GGN14466.1 cytochrome P450 [Actinoplanes campanulatus]GID36708.1 cytochrome P450 [Actinoplanes campanulatus]